MKKQDAELKQHEKFLEDKLEVGEDDFEEGNNIFLSEGTRLVLRNQEFSNREISSKLLRCVNGEVIIRERQ